ncbi:MAG: acyl-CoA dehydrogenase family protein [Actinomycetota bacterium]
MNPALPDEAVEFGAAAARAFAALGNVDAARRAEDKPELRAGEIAATLQALGVDELDPRADADALAAAAALCHAAGRVALPYPVAGALLADDGIPFAMGLRVDHGDLFPQWHVADVGPAEPAGPPLATRLGPFVTDLTPRSGVTTSRLPTSGDPRTLRWLALTSWQVLGTVERAIELAVDHVTTRVQFGKPLSAFQAVQFQLADAAVAAAGLRELALFTLWRLSQPQEADVDVLALRVHALDVARSVLRTTQQLHGAAGVCDEYDISVLCRHVQPALRLPFGSERTVDQLAAAVDRDGFDGLFPHGR